MCMRSFLLSLVLLFLFCPNIYAAISLSGDVSSDFFSYNCIDDEGGQDVGLPNSVTQAGFDTSGFDIQTVCFYYDGNTDEMYVGVSSFNDTIFGDVEGDGDPGFSSVGGIVDVANLGSGESLVISLDLDGNSRDSDFDVSTVDILVGVSNGDDLDELGVYNVDNSYDPLNNPSLGFGGTSLAEVSLFAQPSSSVKDLEFIIEDFKQINANEVNQISNSIEFMAFAGSSVSAGIGDDYLPGAVGTISHNIFDLDEDGIEDWAELDGENPTDPSDNDSDGDGCSDGDEDSNQNGVFEPDLGEANPNLSDTDIDGLDDCTELTGDNPTDPNDSDTDGDGLLDGEEDTNSNGQFEPDLNETDPNKADTDNGGVLDKDELDNGFDPNDPTDDQDAASQIGATLGGEQVQGGGVNCSLSLDQNNSFFSFFIIFSGLGLLLGFRQKKSKII